ncbi:hypothetical protein ABEB36_015167 [Hypothenemus hampei]|uniref:Myb/SANT-like DNA-binding domain-containing protein n=1 Tax=Hypothenemus hampei TaxID=57062 RepID=A0ABD1E0W1_HYPHA
MGIIIMSDLTSHRMDSTETDGSFSGCEEILILSTNENDNPNLEPFKWSRENTLLFLELYKKNRQHVGSLRMRNLKALYELIAQQLREITSQNISSENVSNRWKVLERGYKKYVDNAKKTGRGRQNFPYLEAMDDILGTKRNIKPILLLSSESVHTPSLNLEENEESCQITSDKNIDDVPSTSEAVNKKITEKYPVPKRKRTYENKKLKFFILKEMRKERKDYYKESLQLKEKILEEKKRKNDILEKIANKKCYTHV